MSNSKNFTVSIIILNWNGLENTIECLSSLMVVTSVNFNVIVIDNGSEKDESKQIKTQFPHKVEVIRLDKNIGFTGGVNYGLKLAMKKYNPDYYLLLNNDTVVDKHFLEPLITTVSSNKNIGIVSPVIYNKSSKKEILYSGGHINWLFARPVHHTYQITENTKVEFMTGCCILLSKELIQKNGLFDEIFFAYFEDVAYSLLARKNGFTCIVNPKSIIYHSESASLGKTNKIYTYLFSRNRILLVNRYTPYLYKIYFSIFNSFKLIAVLLFFMFTNQNTRGYAFLKGFIDGNKNIGGEPRI